ncbi:hypothetical protein MAR_019423 [Mya arenaria]|uniref:Uncharacterized protein n=1 Tax=Mya arenaria TaxID=6604 RepID=A0ABY7EHV4_MYAAR|nr:hypothetical protein MAR_019423 [Mya arenaria]
MLTDTNSYCRNNHVLYEIYSDVCAVKVQGSGGASRWLPEVLRGKEWSEEVIAYDLASQLIWLSSSQQCHARANRSQLQHWRLMTYARQARDMNGQTHSSEPSR